MPFPYSAIVKYATSLLKEKPGTFNKETLPAIPKLLQVGGDDSVKPGGLGLLLAQRRGEPLHFLLERLAVVLLRLGADVAARRESPWAGTRPAPTVLEPRQA